jgi:hypothetical protein
MTPPDAVSLRAEEREIALAEAQAVHALAADAAYRAELADLVAAAETGELDADAADTFEALLVVALQSGRIRSVYGPGGEQAALRVYRRLPGGKALAESAREVSSALTALAGAELHSIAIDAVGPAGRNRS